MVASFARLEEISSWRFYRADAVYRFATSILIKGGENMTIRDYWVYQKRAVAVPWALYIVKEYNKRYPYETTCLDFTLYHEDIQNPTHSISKTGLHYDFVNAYISDIALAITDETGMSFTNADYEQLEKALFRILQD